MLNRCPWAQGKEIYEQYHDTEWGVPLHDDTQLFEFLTLEAFQAGLSWLTILRKREHFRHAFEGFDPERVARFGPAEEARLMADAGIVRNRAKIAAAIGNARAFLEIQKEHGSFDRYIWSFVDGQPIVNRWRDMSEVPPKSEVAERISQALRGRGFRFVGATVVYAHMQATGMINDHLVTCPRHGEVQRP